MSIYDISNYTTVYRARARKKRGFNVSKGCDNNSYYGKQRRKNLIQLPMTVTPGEKLLTEGTHISINFPTIP